MINKIKGFYLWFFSKVAAGWRKVKAFNKRLIDNIKQDFRDGKYLKGSFKSIGYVLFFLIQVILAALLAAAYIMCKLTGICLII